MNNPFVVIRYKAKNDRKINRSYHHKDLWLVTCSDGVSWFSIHATQAEMVRRNPPKGEVICEGMTVSAKSVTEHYAPI